MVCKYCGRKTKNESDVCENCESDMLEDTEDEQDTYDDEDTGNETAVALKKSGNNSKIILFFIAVAVLIFGGYQLLKGGFSKTNGSDSKLTEPTQNVASYYKDDTVKGAFNTYLQALMNDDYDTYLKITRNSDSEETKNEFNKLKKGYVGIDSISYGQVRTGSLYEAGAAAEYKVAVYNSDGTQEVDYYRYSYGNDYSYGLVVVKELNANSGTYYISSHVRYFNFNYDY